MSWVNSLRPTSIWLALAVVWTPGPLAAQQTPSPAPARRPPPAPARPWVVQNPLAPPPPSIRHGLPVPGVPVRVPAAKVGPGWQQVHALVRAGNYAAAQQQVERQLQRDPSLPGLLSALTAFEQSAPPPALVAAVRRQTRQLARDRLAAGDDQLLPWIALAKCSLDERDDETFREATRALVERYPNNEYTLYFDGIRQLEDSNWKGAELALRKAHELGLPEDRLAGLLRLAIDNQRWVWQYAAVTGLVVAGWLAGLVGLFVAGRALSALTMRSLRRHGPESASFFERLLRRAYRLVIGLAGVYYYLSLPVVVLVAVALPLALGYALLRLPFLNLGLIAIVLVLGCGGVLTALSGLRAAFVGSPDKKPGRAVGPADAPRLWQVAREVAETAGTRCVDEIRIMPAADLYVVERGGPLRRLRDRGQRVLILGLSSLQGLRLEAFKCILAHEYGHFRNRDTAGGDIALRVNRAMQNFAEAIARRGPPRRWDVAVHFLRGYHRLFRRLTFGASRLQEVLADRVAVHCYGRNAFVAGLTHILRRAVEFDLDLNRAVRDTLRQTRPALSFYQAEPPELDEREEAEEIVRRALDRPTDPDDTHPSPRDRFALAAQVDPGNRPLSDDLALNLLEGNAALLDEMSRLMDALVNAEAGQRQVAQEAEIARLTAQLRTEPQPQAFFERALLFILRGQYRDALHDLNAVITRAPGAHLALYRRALVHKALGDDSAAADDLIRVSALLINTPLFATEGFSLYATLGHCLSRTDRLREAVAAYDTALSLRPDSLACLVGRGRVSALLGNHERALQDFTAAITRWPYSPEAYLERARLFEARGDSEQAEADYTAAHRLDARCCPPAPGDGAEGRVPSKLSGR